MGDLANQDERSTKKAPPLYGDEARKIIESYDCSTLRSLEHCTLHTVLANRGFRSATIRGIQIENTSIEQQGVVLGLRGEKNIKSGELLFTATKHTKHHRACMPCAIDKLKRHLGEMGIDSGPLFRGIDRWDNLGATGLSTKSITEIIRSGAKQAGIANPELFSSHSYRHGVVLTGVINKWSLEDIMLVTLHRSRRGLQAYIEAIDPWYTHGRRMAMDARSKPRRSEDPSRGWQHVVAV